jgi:hypothetical protein
VTCCGYTPSASGGYVWADSEWYSDDEPAGSVDKLVVSPGGLAGVSTGHLTLAQEFRRLVAGLGHAPFKAAIERLPSQLRAVRDKFRADLRSVDVAYEPVTTFALCGFDGGFRGFVFRESAGFEADECDRWTSPAVHDLAETAHDVLELAQKQLRFVQRKCPGASGGKITIAKIGPDGVAQTRVPLLLGNAMSGRRVPSR